jgi:hypothetical protein
MAPQPFAARWSRVVSKFLLDHNWWPVVSGYQTPTPVLEEAIEAIEELLKVIKLEDKQGGAAKKGGKRAAVALA